MNGAFSLYNNLCPSKANASRLHLPAEIVPATHKKAARPHAPPLSDLEEERVPTVLLVATVMNWGLKLSGAPPSSS